MEAVRIHLRDDQGIQRKGEVFQLGIPLAQGELSPERSLILADPGTSEELNFQTSPMAHWPDGSIRWLRLQFLGELQPNEQRTIELRSREASAPALSSLTCEQNRNGLDIDTGAARFHLTTNRPAWTHAANTDPVHHNLSLHNAEGKLCRVIADRNWIIIDHGTVSLSAELTGWFLDGETRLARFHCRLTFYRNSKTVEAETCIHNPLRARHPGGLWDLGDPGSIHFKALTISAGLPTIRKIKLKSEPDKQSVEIASGNCLLYQDSSGGQNWNSLNHVNANGEVTTRFRGYRFSVNDKTQFAGNRASPAITVASSSVTVQATLPRFWQNFPSSIGAYDNQLLVGLFPGEAAEAYELQGGERKTQTAYFHYGGETDALTWTLSPTVPVLEARQYEQSQAFQWFSTDAPRGPLDDLIQQSLDGPSNFFAKREVIDEYGWRNFGDIFADHETLYQAAGEPPLISHYNNQYDAIYGFARQFALTGDRRWHELMDDLAAHVRDIDIYHTDEDRSEYNHGLFWHTDHYLPAHTSTHRTFSKHNDTSSTPGQTGGGPAEQHCYTTGLMYHYFLTGCSASRHAVLDLANWIVNQREGDRSFLGQLELAKRRELPKWRASLRGQSPPDRQYALNRGTGNYLNTLLDTYWLTLDIKWLSRAERVIRSTIHPLDNLEERNLSDTEISWSYLVFLASLARYVAIKLTLEQCDKHVRYALASLKLYIIWIYTNEKPFLESASKLEYPNGTWVAQDVRKATLLLQASILMPGKTNKLRKSSEKWLKYVTDNLILSEESDLARILIILLQNPGFQMYPGLDIRDQYALISKKLDINRSYFGEQPRLGTLSSLLNLIRRLIRGIKYFKFTKEKAWLEARLKTRQ
jgi:hypothetical protein